MLTDALCTVGGGMPADAHCGGAFPLMPTVGWGACPLIPWFCRPCDSHVCNFHYGAERKLALAPRQQPLIKSTARINQQLTDLFVLVRVHSC